MSSKPKSAPPRSFISRSLCYKLVEDDEMGAIKGKIQEVVDVVLDSKAYDQAINLISGRIREVVAILLPDLSPKQHGRP